MISVRKILFSFIVILLNFNLHAEQIKKEEFVKINNCITDCYYVKMIDLGHNVKQRACVYVHQHGFGCLLISNLILHVYQDNEDCLYKNYLLNIDFTDMNNDGYKDLLIAGKVEYSMDICEDIKFIYTYFPEDKKFYCTHRDSSFKLEDSPLAKRDIFPDNHTKESLQNLIEKARKELKIKKGDRVLEESEYLETNWFKPPKNENFFQSEKLRNAMIFGLKPSETVSILAASGAVFFKKINLPYIKNHDIFKIFCGAGIETYDYTLIVARNVKTGKYIELSEGETSFNSFIKSENIELDKIESLEKYVETAVSFIEPKYCQVLNAFKDIRFSPKDNDKKAKAFYLYSSLVNPISVIRNPEGADATLFVLKEDVLTKRHININNDCTIKIDDTELGLVGSLSD